MSRPTIYVIEVRGPGAGWGPIDNGADSDTPHAFFSKEKALQEVFDLSGDKPGVEYRARSYQPKPRRRRLVLP